jgi:hypothetical protein
MGSNFRKNMIFDSNGVYALFFDASGVLQSRNMVQGGSRAVVYSFATLYGGTIQERETPFFPAVPYNPYEQAPLPTQGSRITTPFVIPQTQITTPYVSSDIQIINPLYSQGGRTTPYNKTPFPTTQGPTQQPYRTLLKIRLNNGTIKPLMAMSDPLNPYLKVDEDTGNIIVYDSGGSIVFCLEMVNVKYNTFTSLTIDVEGNWVVSNKYSPGPEYSWNSGIVLPVFEYIGNNSYYYYDKNNQDRNTNVLYEFIEPTTPPTPPTTNPYKKTTIPYNTTVPQGSTPPPNSYTLYTNFDSQGSWNSILPDPYYTEISNADGKADDKCKELCDTKPLCVAASVYDAGNQTKQCRILDKIAGVDSTTEYITYVENVNFYSVKNKPFYKPQNGYDNFNHYWTYANYGNDIVSFIIPEKSGLDIDYVCRQACDYNPECSLCTVSHYGTTHTCWLKNEISSEGLKYDTNCNTYVKTDVGQPKFDTFNIEEKYQGFALTKLTGTTTTPITVVNGAWECSKICDTRGDGCAGFYINNTDCSLYSQVQGKEPDSGGNSYAKYVGANKAKVFAFNKTNIWDKTERFNNFTVLQMTPTGWHETGYVDIKLACEAEVYLIGGSGGGGSGALGSGEDTGGSGGGGGTGYATYGKIGPGTFSIRIGKGGSAASPVHKNRRPSNPGGNGGETYILNYGIENPKIITANGGKGGGGGYFRNSFQGHAGTGGTGGTGFASGSKGRDNRGTQGPGGSTTYNPLDAYSLTVSGGKGGLGSSQSKNRGYGDYNGSPGSGTCGWIYIKYYD